MKLLKPYALILILGLPCLFSCAARVDLQPIVPATQLPPAIAVDPSAGRGEVRREPLFLTLHLENGEEVLFFADTGAPGTCLDNSLGVKLGRRVGSQTIWSPDGGREKSSVYAAPKLFLGNTPLVTGSRVATMNLSGMSFRGQEVRGVLGMDCLRHYCIQLDFEAGQMRFLDPNRLDVSGLGKAFPLTFSTEGHVFIDSGFIGPGASPVLIDTGCVVDALLQPKVFEREVREQRAIPARKVASGRITGQSTSLASIPRFVWNGETYTDLVVEKEKVNVIGLKFLARHQVTFNFPMRTVYLKRTTSGAAAAD